MLKTLACDDGLLALIVPVAAAAAAATPARLDQAAQTGAAHSRDRAASNCSELDAEHATAHEGEPVAPAAAQAAGHVQPQERLGGVVSGRGDGGELRGQDGAAAAGGVDLGIAHGGFLAVGHGVHEGVVGGGGAIQAAHGSSAPQHLPGVARPRDPSSVRHAGTSAGTRQV